MSTCIEKRYQRGNVEVPLATPLENKLSVAVKTLRLVVKLYHVQ